MLCHEQMNILSHPPALHSFPPQNTNCLKITANNDKTDIIVSVRSICRMPARNLFTTLYCGGFHSFCRVWTWSWASGALFSEGLRAPAMFERAVSLGGLCCVLRRGNCQTPWQWYMWPIRTLFSSGQMCIEFCVGLEATRPFCDVVFVCTIASGVCSGRRCKTIKHLKRLNWMNRVGRSFFWVSKKVMGFIYSMKQR